jgi:chlorite dismutase
VNDSNAQEPTDHHESAVLGHFTTYRLTREFWALGAGDRQHRLHSWLSGLQRNDSAIVTYLTQGLEHTSDMLVWSSCRVPVPDAARDFFVTRARAEAPHRMYVEPVHGLWGLTRPSEYSRAAKSAQEIDPFAAQRAPWLIVYPFTKTTDWYLLSREERQAMMNEHIRVGKQYRAITQLLLYSFGLQDQEFVVVYETEDPALFSRLVYDLRGTEGRRHTKDDTPLHTGVRIDAEELPSLFG